MTPTDIADPSCLDLDRRRFLRLGLGAVIGGGLLSHDPALADPNRQLRLVGSNSVPLKSFVDTQGRRGFAVDIAEAVVRHAGFAPDPSLMPWERAMELGRQRKGLIMAIFKTPDREAVFDFTDAVFEDEVVVVTRRGHEFPLSGPMDLIGRRCAVQQGAQYGDSYAAIQPLLTLDTDNNPSTRLLKLLRRDFDCALFNPGRAGVSWLINANGLRAEDFSVLPLPLAQISSFMAIGHSPANGPMLQQLNRSISTLRRDGTIDRLMRSYL
jgi:polar amino acid transport system substrate-binding protein